MTLNSELLNLRGKTAIVTGAVGIGYGIAYRLAQAGASIVLASLYKEEAIDSAKRLVDEGWIATAMECDVSKEDDVKRVVEETLKIYGGVDILINNAGIYPMRPISQMSLDEFKKVIDVNLNGVFLCTKYVSEVMMKSGGGRIINVTSIDALHPSSTGLAHYDASKHGVWGFTKNAALEFAKYKIWVNAVAPGGIITPGVEKLQEGAVKNPEPGNFLAKIPMGRMGEADEIGKVVLFLASEMSSYITGTQIVVDGGRLLS